MIEVPVEIVKIIVESLVHYHESTRSRRSDSTEFLPRSYLTSLLRVCKLWYAVAEEYLYRSVSIGSKHPLRSEGRSGHTIAIDLLTTLEAEPRLAKLIKELWLGTDGDNTNELAQWLQTNIRILRLCPNVEHVEIRGFRSHRRSLLIDALKENSLISFSIDSRNLSMYGVPWGKSVQVFDVMRTWPKLRTFHAKHYLGNVEEEKVLAFDPSQASKYCPELQEIVFTGSILYNEDFRVLRAMCGGVMKLNVPLNGSPSESRRTALDGLCECLHAWSATLEYVKLHIQGYRSLYQPLSEALSMLQGLRELQLVCTTLDLGSIATLPLLERLLCDSPSNPQQLNSIAEYLETAEKFPSLRLLVYVRPGSLNTVFSQRLENICQVRRIKLGSSREALSDFVM